MLSESLLFYYYIATFRNRVSFFLKNLTADARVPTAFFATTREMFRRRTSKSITKPRDVYNGSPEDGKFYDKSNKSKSSTSSPLPTIRMSLIYYLIACMTLSIRCYLNGITAAGNETWYPVPLIGFVRSDLALVCSLAGSIPFLLLFLRWTFVGILSLLGLAVWIPLLVMLRLCARSLCH